MHEGFVRDDGGRLLQRGVRIECVEHSKCELVPFCGLPFSSANAMPSLLCRRVLILFLCVF
jgi:hypothetical protein